MTIYQLTGLPQWPRGLGIVYNDCFLSLDIINCMHGSVLFSEIMWLFIRNMHSAINHIYVNHRRIRGIRNIYCILLHVRHQIYFFYDFKYFFMYLHGILQIGIIFLNADTCTTSNCSSNVNISSLHSSKK